MPCTADGWRSWERRLIWICAACVSRAASSRRYVIRSSEASGRLMSILSSRLSHALWHQGRGMWHAYIINLYAVRCLSSNHNTLPMNHNTLPKNQSGAGGYTSDGTYGCGCVRVRRSETQSYPWTKTGQYAFSITGLGLHTDTAIHPTSAFSEALCGRGPLFKEPRYNRCHPHIRLRISSH